MASADRDSGMSEEHGTEGDGAATGEDGVVTAAGGRPCPVCEEAMYHRHCKYVCPNHGVIMDCADTFY